MEPDRHPAENREELDDTQLLTAIERAWPVPPMTGRLIGRDWSNESIASRSGSFSAPLPNLPVPRFRPGLSRQSFLRIAAVLALLLTSVFGVIAFNNRSEENPTYSIAAPSPFESACTLPLRSREELTEIVTEVKEQIDAGKITTMPQLESAEYSVYELSLDGSGSESAVDAWMDAVKQCIYAGVNQARIQAIGPGVYIPFVANVFGIPNLSVEDAVDRIMAPVVLGGTPIAEMQKSGPPQTTLLTSDDGARVAAFDPDIFGNRFGYVIAQTDDGWRWDGLARIQGEWSSLTSDNTLSVTGCSSTSIQSDETMAGYLSNQAWTLSALPLFAQLSPSRLDSPEVDVATEDAVRTTIEGFRQCIQSGIEPYRFAQSTEAFFGEFASFAGAGPTSPVSDLGLMDPVLMFTIIPSAVTSVVKLEENKVLAVLAVDQQWTSTGKVPAIILVNVDGQWLINQLAIVQG